MARRRVVGVSSVHLPDYEQESESYMIYLENKDLDLLATTFNKELVKDVDYVIEDDAIIIVDQFTGRLMHGRQFSEIIPKSGTTTVIGLKSALSPSGNSDLPK